MRSIRELAMEGMPLEGIDVIDVHAHIGRPNFACPEWTAEKLVSAAGRVGVRELWASRMAFGSPYFSCTNTKLSEDIANFPERLRGYLTPPPDSAREAEAETEKWLERGFLGVKLHHGSGIMYDIPEYEPVWKIASERRLPVLLHTWGEAQVLDCVEKFAAKYKGASIIMGHGILNINEERYEKIASSCENVYIDTCLSRTSPGRIEEIVGRIGSLKILFGSDTAYLSLSHQAGKIALADISEEDKKRIFSGNAKKILERVLAR